MKTKHEAWEEWRRGYDPLVGIEYMAFLESWEACEEQGIQALADIREAVGDPEGKLMQDELVERVKGLVKELYDHGIYPTWRNK